MTAPMAETTALPNLGPNTLNTTESDDFLIPRSDLYTLQVYIETALQQPTTETALRTLIATASGIANPTDEELRAIKVPNNTKTLLETFTTMIDHCRTWKTKTFPEMIALAGDIVQYNLQVPAYYSEIVKLIPALRKQDPNAKETLHALIDDLADQAQSRADHAATVASKAQQFHTDTVSDGKAIHALVEEYAATISENGTVGRELRKKFEEQKKIHEAAIAEYHHATVVAATTPTYSFAYGPFSLIAAVVVAGVYGDRAVKAKNRIDGAIEQMKTLARQMDENSQLVQSVSITARNVTIIETQLQAAIPVIKRIQQSWTGISQELLSIKRLLTEEMSEALPTQLSALVNKAIGEWREVSKLADRYRVLAFIDIQAPSAVAA